MPNIDINSLKSHFHSLYQKMIDSKDVKNMMIFGSVMNDLMDFVIDNSPTFASNEIDKLESINWRQYLTRNEAEQIFQELKSDYKWPFDTWDRAMKTLELDREEENNYNCYSLWAMMNVIYSKHGYTIGEKIIEISSKDITSTQMVSFVYSLAIDSFKDEKFDIRKYLFNH